jgi:hypothetical protein
MSSVILNDVLNNIDQEEIMKLINNMDLLSSTLQHSKYNMITYDELSNYFLYICSKKFFYVFSFWIKTEFEKYYNNL